ncbi:hypothetical protein WG904_13710 [Pedobacter sp. Du54]|uniref:hypothetical protein n=1 Tax=Pedobacter anseongensis TaxID=3133439 RepID=UPI0030ADBE69
MGITASVIEALKAICPTEHIATDKGFTIIQCSSNLYIHLISLATPLRPEELLKLQERYQQKGKLLVHLWEDVWLSKQSQVLSRIKSFLGLNETFHGRKAKLIAVKNEQAAQFFNTYHLQGFVKAKYHYGLAIEGEVIAMASFSESRPMKSKGSQYTSAELVRFASKDGYTLTGGLSKLIKHHLKQVRVNDLMTYADRDWSLGKGYDQLGFQLTTVTKPAYLYVEEKTNLRYFPHRLPKTILSAFDQQKDLDLDEYLAQLGYAKVFNTGNLKYHLYV